MPLAPYNRRELFLEAIRTRDTSALPDPNNREELFLKDIADQVAAIPAGISVSIPAELSELLANLPEPHTHTERFYNDIIGALLVATTVTDTTPYITRVTAGGLPVTGTAELKKKLGNTVCVNQLREYMVDSHYANGLTFTRNEDGSLDISGTVTTAFNYDITPITAQNTVFLRDGRKYLIWLNQPIAFNVGVGGYPASLTAGNTAYIFSVSGGTPWKNGITMQVYLGDVVNITNLFVYIHELPIWFGSNDRIPSDLLSHPENWGDYYAGSLDYEPGRLVSADGTTLRSYDENGNLLDATDTGNELLLNYDSKEPNGTITRGTLPRVDLSSLEWNYDDTIYPGAPYFYSNAISGAKPSSRGMTSRYINDTSATFSMPDKSFKITSARRVYLIDHSYTSAAALTAALAGIMLECEASTPITEQGTDFNPGYAVEAGGTESWLQDQSTGVPQGHETEYKEFTT